MKYKYIIDFNKKYNLKHDIKHYSNNELYLINKMINNLENILETNNSNILFYIGLIFYYKYNKISEAEKYYLLAINIDNTNSSYIYEYGFLLDQEDRIEEAIKYYLMAIELDNCYAIFKYGLILQNNNKIEEAKKLFSFGVKLNNGNLINKYAILLELDNIEEAKKHYLIAINLNNCYAMYNYAILLINEKKIEEATKYFNMAISIATNNEYNEYISDQYEIINKIAFFFEKNNDYNTAKKILLLGVKLNFSFSINNYAYLLEKENQLEEAKKYYLIAINLNNQDAMNNYALLLYKENKIEEAKKYLLQVFNVNKENRLKSVEKTVFENYIAIEKNILKCYINLKNININNINIVQCYVKKLELNYIIQQYINSNKKNDTCYICYTENIEVISYKCNNNHYLCEKCYLNINKCPYCRL